jgi:AsmA protein
MKFLKISLIALLGLVAILVIGGGIFVATFDANQYKVLISEQVKQQVGREFSVSNIKPSLFPWLGIELQQITLGNAAGFTANNMLQMEQLDVRLEILPLLSQQLRIDTLKIHGLELFLQKNKRGKTNWDDLLEKQVKTSATPAQKKTRNEITDKPTTADPLAGITLNGVELKNASISWNDESGGKNLSFHNINLTTGALRAGEVLPVTFATELDLSEPEVHIAVNLSTSLEMDFSAQKFTLADCILNIDLQGKTIPGEKQQLSVGGRVALDLQKQRVEIKPLNLKMRELNASVEMVVNDLLAAPDVKGRFAIEEFNPRSLLKSINIELPKTQSDAVLKKASLTFDFIASEKKVELSSLAVKLDKSTLLANLTLQNLAKPKINYSAKLDQIVLDDYLSPVAKPKKHNVPAKALPPQQKADIPIELPVPLMRSLNVNGVFQVASLRVSDQLVTNLKIKTVAKSGLIKLPELSANVLQGKLISSARLDVRKNIPRYQFKANGNRLKAESVVNPILQDLLGEKSVSMTGDTNFNMNIKTRGQSVKQLIAGSNGTFKLNMGKAKLHGVDAEYFVRKGVVDYIEKKKQPVPQAWKGEYKPKQTTALKVARASAVIKNGVVENKDLLLNAPRFTITGAGKINLPRERLNYRVLIDVKPGKTKTAGERLLDVPMPVFVKGSFAQPQISIDSKVWLKSVGKELKAEVKTEIKQKLKKEKKKKADKLKRKYKDKLRGFFK